MVLVMMKIVTVVMKSGVAEVILDRFLLFVLCWVFVVVACFCSCNVQQSNKENVSSRYAHKHTLGHTVTLTHTGVALTFEKLRIANAQHGKNCVSSPAAKATISTDLPKIDKHKNTNV